ncbi:recombinase family protein [Streptomyces scabiei]|uniref:recombinase family protein n=1 Tax=Streptomyces scabiei TaxID=1930 RepID=UPI0029AF4C11|nr:recombinase family protein [Streptomyces scabiei]MDX3277305.1 recombinase family protein [Streptomyces scabiei]
MTDAPKAYGYIRLRESDDDQELCFIEERISDYADSCGLRLVHTHYEDGPGISPYRLIHRLIRNDVRHVVVLSLAQITTHPLLQLLVSEAITLDAGALLYEANEVHGRADAP